LFFDHMPSTGNVSTEWGLVGKLDAVYQVDVSTNLTDWSWFATISNTHGVFAIKATNQAESLFFRVHSID